jgi:hypothetical protein
LTVGLLAVAGFIAPSLARAAVPPCSTLPNPVYLQVADTQEPLIKALGKQLRASAVNPITLIYKLNGSCTNIDAVFNGAKLTTNPSYVPSQAEVPGWEASQPSPQCTIDVVGVPIALASSEPFISTCTSTAVPASIDVVPGAINPAAFVVPKGSTQQAITAEQAYFVFGFGAEGQVTPWNDPAFIFIRPLTKGILMTMSPSIRVPASRWQGTPLANSSDIVNAVGSSTSPEKTLGVLATSVYDATRNQLKALAYRTFQQRHAYFPDSTSETKDKRNVRDGHYTLWSRASYLVPQGNPRAQYVVGLLADQAVSPAPDFDPLATVIGSGFVPACAMSVTRSVEGGDLSPYAPAAPCGCFFDSQLGTSPASCVACDVNKPCSTGTCRHGFCEAR